MGEFILLHFNIYNKARVSRHCGTGVRIEKYFQWSRIKRLETDLSRNRFKQAIDSQQRHKGYSMGKSIKQIMPEQLDKHEVGK